MSKTWLRQLLRKKFLGSPAGPTSPIMHNLSVEALEERAMLAVAVWDGGAVSAPADQNPNSLWSDARNWVVPGLGAGAGGESGYIPQNGDEVIFPAGLSAARKPLATIVNGALVFPVNSTFDLNGLRLSGLRIDDDHYHIDAITPQTLFLEGRILTQIAQTPGTLSGVSLIGPQFVSFDPLTGLPLPSNLQIRLTSDVSRLNSFESATGSPGALYIRADLVDNSFGYGNGIQKTGGGGPIVLAGTNTFTGNVTVAQGTLIAASDSALGAATRGTTVSNGASMGVSFGATVTDSLVITGTGVNGRGALLGITDPLSQFGGRSGGGGSWAGGIALSGNSSIGTFGGDLSVEGVGISGSGDLSKVGAGQLFLLTPNTYGGNTLIREGSILIFDDQALSLNPAFSTTVSAGASLEVYGGLTVNETLFLNGTGFYVDGSGRRTGALHVFDGVSTWVGTITLQTDSYVGSDLGSQLLLAGELLGAARMTKSDQGNVRIARANNNYTGNTTVSLGTLEIANALALGRSGNVTVESTAGALATVGTLQMEGAYTFTRPLTLNGVGFAGAGALSVVGGSDITLTANVVLANDTSVNVRTAANLRVNSTISSVAGTPSSLEKTGLGTLYLAGNNTYAGATTLREGLTVLQNANGLGSVATATSTRVVAGAALRLATPMTLTEELVLSGQGVNGTGGALQVGAVGVQATGRITLLGVDTSRADINVAAGGSLTFSNVVGGDADFHKIGAGELRLSGPQSNTFLTPTYVDEGRLVLAKSPGLIALGGQVFVGDGIGGNNSDELRFESSNQVPERLGTTTIVMTVGSTGLVNLNGFNETFGALTLIGGEVITGAGLLTLASDVNVIGSTDHSRLVGNVSLGGVTRTFSALSTPGMQFFASEGPVQFGQPVTFTVTVTGVVGGPTATGLVSFYDGTVFLGSAFVNAGVATFTTSGLSAGSHNITAVYTDTSADPVYGTRTIALPSPLAVVGAPSRQLLSANTNPVEPGDLLTFTYTVTRTATTNPLPTGTVTFYADNTSDGFPRFVIGSATVGLNGVATLNTGLPVGSYTISAEYSGDAAYAAGSATLATPQVVVDAPELRVISSANSSAVGQNVTFTFTAVPGGPGSPVPTGTVSFFDGATLIGTVQTLNGSGVATISTAALTAGTKVITAVYSGDSFYEAQTVVLLGGQVVVNAPTLLLSSNNSQARPGEAVTFTFQVNNAAATGTVTFRNNGTPLGAAVPVVGGVATFTTALLPASTAANNNVIDAVYTGGGGSAGGTAVLAPVQVVANPLAVALSSSANPSQFGQNITLNFIADREDPSDPAPTGTVTFFDGTTQIGVAVPLTALFFNRSSASITTTVPLTFGGHLITARYSGDARYAGTTVTLSTVQGSTPAQQLVTAAPSLQLVSSDATSVVGQTVTYNFTTVAQTGTPQPTGTVEFFEDGVSIGVFPLTVVGQTGTANVTRTYNSAGSHVITAVYSGNTFYQVRSVTMAPNQSVTLTAVVPPSTTLPSLDAVAEINAPLTNGGAAAGIRVVGSGETILNGANAYTGPTTVASGLLTLGANNVLPDTQLTISAGGVLNVNGKTDTVGSLEGAGTLALAGGSLTVGGNNASTAFTGPITGTGALRKVGAGTLTLSGASPGYTGATFVSGGTVIINGNHANANAVAQSGGTIAGTGTVNAMNVNAGGKLSPGQGPGTTGVLTAAGTVAINAGSTFIVDANGTTPGTGYDQLNVAGTVAINGATLSFTPGSAMAIGNTFDVIVATGGITGTFAGLAEGATFTLNNRVFQISYQSNRVRLTVTANAAALAVVSSNNPALPNTPITFTFTITPTLGTDTRPTGTVQFYDNGVAIGAPVTLTGGATGAGTAVLVVDGTLIPFLASGPHTITAEYVGDASYLAGTARVQQQVTSPSTTIVAPQQGPTVFGDNAGFLVTVPRLAGLPVPTGTVTFVNAATGQVLGVVALNGAGQAVFATTALPAGTATIRAVYSGDTFYRTSSGTATQVVDRQNRIVVGSDAGPVATVQVFDSRSGALLQTLQPFDQYTLGVKVATGDVNGDGIADIIVSAGAGAPGGHVRVFDGATFAEVASFFTFVGYTGGVNIAAGDVDGDGFADVIVGTAIANDHVKAFSGRGLVSGISPDASTLMSFFAYGGGNPVGVTVGAGDVDGDGRADVITGSATFAGHVKVFQGGTAQIIGSYFAYGEGYLGGIYVAGGDLNGDGRSEIITGATNAPHVKALTQAGTELASFFAYTNADGSPAPFGVRVGAADRNGDRLADIITGAGGSAPAVKVFSGLDPSLLLESFLAVPVGQAPSTSGVFVGGSTK